MYKRRISVASKPLSSQKTMPYSYTALQLCYCTLLFAFFNTAVAAVVAAAAGILTMESTCAAVRCSSHSHSIWKWICIARWLEFDFELNCLSYFWWPGITLMCMCYYGIALLVVVCTTGTRLLHRTYSNRIWWLNRSFLASNSCNGRLTVAMRFEYYTITTLLRLMWNLT